MKIKLNKSQQKLLNNGNVVINSDGNNLVWNPLYYRETREPNMFEVLTFKELNKAEQRKVLDAQVNNLKHYMELYGE